MATCGKNTSEEVEATIDNIVRSPGLYAIQSAQKRNSTRGGNVHRTHPISRTAHTSYPRAGSLISLGGISCPTLNYVWGRSSISSILVLFRGSLEAFRGDATVFLDGRSGRGITRGP